MSKYIRKKIYIEAGKHFKFDELSSTEAPFSSMKDVFMVSATLGYNRNKRQKIDDNKDIFDKSVFSDHDLTVLHSLFLDHYEDVNALEDSDKEVLKLVEEFANGGIDELYKIVIEQQGEGIMNLVEEILVNYS